MAKSPMVEASIVVLEAEGKELTFNELFEKVVEELQMDKDMATKRIAKLYSDITLDRRFISLPDNKWDLRKRRKLDEVLIDSSDIIIEEDEELDYDYDDEDEDEEKEKDDDEEENVDIFDVVIEKEYDEDIEDFKELAIASED